MPSVNGMHTAGIFSDMTVDGPDIGTLVVIIDRAKNLPNRKTMGKQDPYCAARLGKEAKKTDTDRRGGQTPRWDQELRFTVHESPDYYNLKVSVFNDDKKTDLIGETWVRLEEVIMHGGGQSDVWHTLHCKGKYAGEIRIELTYYDARPKMEKSMTKEENVDVQSQKPYTKSERKNIDATRRRPLPAGPSNVARKSVLSQPQAREFDDDQHQNTHTYPGTPSGDSRSRYHHSWDYDVSQGPYYHNDRNPELLRDRHIEQFGPNALNTDNSYIVNQHISHEKPYDGYRPEAQLIGDAEDAPGYKRYSPSSLNEQIPNLSAMRSRTEPVPTSQAHVQQYQRSTALPEHTMIPAGYVSEVGRSPYHARQDTTGPSEVPNTYMGERSALSDSIGVAPQDSAFACSFTASHRPSDVGYRQQGDDRNLSNSYGDCGNPHLAQVYHPLYHQNNSIQPEIDHSFSNTETGFNDHNEIPPPPPLHRTTLCSSENGLLRQSESVVLAPIPLRHARQEVSHRHSYPNHYANSHEHAGSGNSQDELTQHISQFQTSVAAYPEYDNGQHIRNTSYQASNSQETLLRSSRTSFPNESSAEENFPAHPNTEVLQQSVRKRPLSLSIGGYQYEEDMYHSRSSQSAMMQPENMGPRKSFTHGDLTNPGPLISGDRASFGSQPRNSRETTPLTKSQVANPGMSHARSSNHSTPTRKSVSPQPSRSTGTSNGISSNMPFSPDSYENMHPSQHAISVSPVPQVENQLHTRSQGLIDSSPVTGTPAAKSTAATNPSNKSQDEPIIGPDGHVIDPSDHLPVDSWAPEPERKNPHKPAPIRVRVSPRGAQPMPSSGKRENATRTTAYSASPLSSSTTTATLSSAASERNAANDSSSDARVRTRLQKRHRGGKGAVGARHENTVGSEGPGTSMGAGMASPPYEPPGAAVPPVPAKILVGAGVDVNGGGHGSDDLMALSEEMKSIDIGMGSGRSTGRVRRGR